MKEKQISMNIIHAQKTNLQNWESTGTYRAVNVLYYVTAGTADIEINNRLYHLKKGDLMLCPLSSYTAYKQTSEVFEKYFIHFYMSCDGIPVFSEYEFEYVIHPEDEESLVFLFQYITEGYKYKNMFNRFEYWHKLTEILRIFFKETKITKKELSLSEHRAYMAMDYMTRNYMKKLSNENISEYIGVHTKYLQKIFKSTFNESIKFYLNFIRTESITSLAMCRDVSLKELARIGEYSGYTSLKKWYSQFRCHDIKDEKLMPFATRYINGEKYSTMLYLTVQNAFKSKKLLLSKNDDCIIFLNKGTMELNSVTINEKEAFFINKNRVREIEYKEECEIFHMYINVERFLIGKDMEKLNNPELFYELFTDFTKRSKIAADVFKTEEYLLKILMDVFASEEKIVFAANVSEVCKFIEENINKSISCKSAAEHFAINPATFTKLFYDKMGVSLFSYIENIKYKKAMELITDTNISIKEIAEATGFASYEGFRRFIKRKTGSFPKELRMKGEKKWQEEQKKNTISEKDF